MRKGLSTITMFLMLAVVGWSPLPARPASSAAAPSLIFPILGGGTFRNDFGDPRDGGTRSHEGNDIFAAKHTPLLAVANGTISWVAFPEPSWGMCVTLRADDGYEYRYLHVNNDRPGTDDNSGLPWFAYAPDISQGMVVRAGQVIGYNGDSGNAEHTRAHLHFEMRDPNRQLLNPYEALLAAHVIDVPFTAARQENELLPYRDLTLGAHVAVGNLDDDSGVELAVSPLAGGGPHVRLFDHDGTSDIGGFFAYQHDYPGGVDVALGDLDGDGIDEIITAPGPGGTPHIRTFAADGMPFGIEFLAYAQNFPGGVAIHAADLNGDGFDEIITGSGPGMEPTVRIFKANGTLQNEFLAYDPAFRGGIDVAATDGNTTNQGNIVTSPGPGGGPHIKVFLANGTLQNEFLAYDPAFRGAIRVSARGRSSDPYGRNFTWWDKVLLAIECTTEIRKDAYGNDITVRECTETDGEENETTTSTRTGSTEIFTVPASGGGGDVRRFTGDGDRIAQSRMFDTWWIGGFDIAAGGNAVYVASTGGPEPDVERRTSVRPTSTRISR